MSEPLDEAVKKEIDEWRESGAKYSDWIEKNLSKLNEIYCNKETIISDRNTEISLPIKSLTLKNDFLMVEGEHFKKWIHAFDYSFNEKYTMTVTEFAVDPYPNKLKIGFKVYAQT